MNFIFFIGIGILATILIVGVLFGLPSTKGWAGERAVRTILKTLPDDQYIILNDVKFYGRERENKVHDTSEGKRWSCQIDHLVISPFGIFCIETKSYLGVIRGEYHEKYLGRRVLGMKYQTYSPIYQNYRHLQRLVEYFPEIKANSSFLHSIVCFLPIGFFNIKGSGAATICMAQDLKKNILRHNSNVISEQEVEKIANSVRKSSLNH